MKGWRIALFCLVATSLFSPPHLVAQAPGSSTRAWLGAGLAGGAGTEIGSGLGLLIQVAGQREPHQVTMRLIALASDVASFPDGGGRDMSEFSVLYGRVAVRSFGHASVSAGLGVVADGPSEETRYTVGLPFAAELGLGAVIAGFGAQAFGNLNPRSPFVGLALFIELGWLR